jgi:hypothetical protein
MVVPHHVKKGVIGLKNPTFGLPDENADDVGVHQPPNPRFTLCEIAVQKGILGHIHQRSDNLQIAGRISQGVAQHMHELE